jgi:hypothetical protein
MEINHTQQLIDHTNEEARLVRLRLTFLSQFSDRLTALNLRCTFYDDYLDFDRLERPDVLRVIKAFPGRWNKTSSYDGRINYTLEEPHAELTLRLWGAEAPDSCVIEERVEYVHVPARTERRVTRTLKCPEPTEADASVK